MDRCSGLPPTRTHRVERDFFDSWARFGVHTRLMKKGSCSVGMQKRIERWAGSAKSARVHPLGQTLLIRSAAGVDRT